MEKLLKQIGKESEQREEIKDLDLKKIPIVVYSIKDGEKTRLDPVPFSPIIDPESGSNI